MQPEIVGQNKSKKHVDRNLCFIKQYIIFKSFPFFVILELVYEYN